MEQAWSLMLFLPKLFHGTRSRGSPGDLVCFTLVARGLGDCHGLGAVVPPRSTGQGGRDRSRDRSREQSQCRAEPCAEAQPERELLLAAPNGEPHSRWERFEAGKRHPGSGKLTASLCSILLKSVLHLLLSPRVICMQIKHGWEPLNRYFLPKISALWGLPPPSRVCKLHQMPHKTSSKMRCHSFQDQARSFHPSPHFPFNLFFFNFFSHDFRFLLLHF